MVTTQIPLKFNTENQPIEGDYELGNHHFQVNHVKQDEYEEHIRPFLRGPRG